MKKQTYYTYQLQDYPTDSADHRGFYLIRISDLVQQIQGINQPHAHSFYLLMYVWAGAGTHTVDDQIYPVTPPQLYFLTPGQVHGWTLTNDAQGYLLFFDAAFFQARFPKRLFEYQFFRPERTTAMLLLRSDGPVLPTLFDWAYQEFTKPTPQHLDVIASLLHLMLENASQLYEQAVQSPSHRRTTLVRRFEELLETQFVRQKVCLAYADQLGVTPNHLNHCCRQQLGKTASQLIQDRVIAEAARLLVHTDLAVKAIGYSIGFADTAYFSRFFRNNTGQTPQQFRLLYREKH